MADTRTRTTKLQKNSPHVSVPPDILHDLICFAENPSGPFRVPGLLLCAIRHNQPPWQLMAATLFTLPHVSAVRRTRARFAYRVCSPSWEAIGHELAHFRVLETNEEVGPCSSDREEWSGGLSRHVIWEGWIQQASRHTCCLAILFFHPDDGGTTLRQKINKLHETVRRTVSENSSPHLRLVYNGILITWESWVGIQAGFGLGGPGSVRGRTIYLSPLHSVESQPPVGAGNSYPGGKTAG